MRRIYFTFLFLGATFASIQLSAQTDIYTETGGELLFQFSEVELTDAAIKSGNYEKVDNPMRFTLFFHLGQYVHMDFTNNLGLYSGLAIRNVGFISDEKINPDLDGDPSKLEDYKIIRRSYTLGIPLAIKLGSFDDHFFFMAGGEMEWNFAYKEKYWNANTRSGAKTKYSEWFANQTPTFIPSAFVGVQFPKGIALKFKYYLNDFIDNTYTSKNPIFDLTRYKKTEVMYISLSWNLKINASEKRQTK